MTSKKLKLLVTGCNGLVGSAIMEQSNLYLDKYKFVFIGSEVDLRDRATVDNLFYTEDPDCVIHTAARVGGIKRNKEQGYLQYYDNMTMNTNVLDSARRARVRKLIAFSSLCAIPEWHQESFSEELLHDGEPYPARS